jgi:putative glutamine amidotransferase
MRRPRVGLTLDLDVASGEYRLGRAYVDAVLGAGGLPVPLPYGDDSVAGAYLSLCDAVVITGGDFDIAPERYGEERRPGCRDANEPRTAFEWALCEAALAARLPLLGICGGMQLLNVARGGSLHQDLASELGLGGHERGVAPKAPRHQARVVPGTLLARLAGAGPITVNSTHHQAVRTVGAGVLVSARAPDEVVEAIELPDQPFALGVQWHPERLVGDPAHGAIWAALVAAARDLHR